jgi:hypothetical protein
MIVVGMSAKQAEVVRYYLPGAQIILQWEELLREYVTRGCSMSELATRHGLTLETVRYRLAMCAGNAVIRG